MANSTIFERETKAGITDRVRGAVAGMKQAMATISRNGVTLPAWFLAVATAAFLSLGGGVLKVAWSTGETVSATAQTAAENKAAIAREDVRIDRLEGVFADVASMKTDLASTKQTAEHTDEKVDRLIDRELSRQRP